MTTMPCQMNRGKSRNALSGRVPESVHMKAYEVYCHCWGEQAALVEGECRGGFGVNELIAFLYASSFPKSEWRKRVDEAMDGLEV